MRSKYHNKKVIWKGEEFDSKREMNRYCELLLLQRARKITGLSRQVRFELIPNQKAEGQTFRKVEYIADFTYWENGKFVVEDCKGFRTDTYIIKKKLMLQRYGHVIRET